MPAQEAPGLLVDVPWLVRNAIDAFNVENAKPEEAALD